MAAKRGRSATAAASQFLQESAESLIEAHRAAAQMLHPVQRGESSPAQALGALQVAAARQSRIREAEAKFMASLSLAGVTREAIAEAIGTRRETVTHRIAASPAAARIAGAGGRTLKRDEHGRWHIQQPSSRPRRRPLPKAEL